MLTERYLRYYDIEGDPAYTISGDAYYDYYPERRPSQDAGAVKVQWLHKYDDEAAKDSWDEMTLDGFPQMNAFIEQFVRQVLVHCFDGEYYAGWVVNTVDINPDWAAVNLESVDLEASRKCFEAFQQALQLSDNERQKLLEEAEDWLDNDAPIYVYVHDGIPTKRLRLSVERHDGMVECYEVQLGTSVCVDEFPAVSLAQKQREDPNYETFHRSRGTRSLRFFWPDWGNNKDTHRYMAAEITEYRR